MLSDRVYDRCFGLRGLFLCRRNVGGEGKVSREHVYQVIVHRHRGGKVEAARLLVVLRMSAGCTSKGYAAYLAANILGGMQELVCKKPDCL